MESICVCCLCLSRHTSNYIWWFAANVSLEILVFILTHYLFEGETKLSRLATADTWKAGSKSNLKGPGGKRILNENKLLTANKARYNPYSRSFRKCRICAQSVHQPEAHYCQSCAFKKGICAMCGVRLVNTTNYQQSSVWRIIYFCTV